MTRGGLFDEREAYCDDTPEPIQDVAICTAVEQLFELGGGHRSRGDTTAPGSVGSFESELPS
jgi:hypothetical protein